jgi:hypothetical protein
VAWLLVEPVRAEGHRDWVILVGTYFASFILADVTTTNAVGDACGTCLAWTTYGFRTASAGGHSGIAHSAGQKPCAARHRRRPHPRGSGDIDPGKGDTRSALDHSARGRGADASWLGVGNLVSVLLPVGYEPLIRRWRQRGDVWRTMVWLTAPR